MLKLRRNGLQLYRKLYTYSLVFYLMEMVFLQYLFLVLSLAMMYFTASCSPVYDDSETAASGGNQKKAK